MIHLLRRLRNNFSSQLSSYVRRGRHRPQTKLQIGSNIHNFELKSQQHYPDFDLTHRHFVNTSTQTNFHQLECSQETNTLSMVFRLKELPYPSINYALQKMLNGGSKAYPIRGLIETVKPYTFNNVLYTSTINQDYMMFNFSSPILKDYKNLLHLYHDMVFRPLLRKEDFAELVWRYQVDQSNRRKLFLRGELADAMVENDYYEENLVYRQIVKSFFNKRNASICSQQELINFNYDDLVRFYRQTVTPKNLTLVNHGDMSAEYILSAWSEICEEKDKKEQEKPIIIQKEYKVEQKLLNSQQDNSKPSSTESLPKTVTFQHMKPQTILMLSFKITNATQQQKALLSILSYLLFDMPQSPFMKFNTPQTPYPLLYGYKNRYFNVGITFNDLAMGEKKVTEAERENIMIKKEREIRQTLEELGKGKVSEQLVEKCLAHLEANYYTTNGLKIIESIIDPILSNQSISSALSPTQLIERLFKKHKKESIFQNLIKKFLLSSNQYICFRGYNNYQVVQNKDYQRQAKLAQIRKTFSDEMVRQIMGYQPPNILQDFKVLPQLRPLDLQFFEDLQPIKEKVDGVNVFYQERLNGVRVTLKSDISDLNQELFPFLELFCKSFPQMGTKHMKDEAYQQILSRYINNISVRYETQKSRKNPNEMKVFLFMTVDFNDRYFEFGFSVLNGLIKGWNHGNIFALSKIIQKLASQCFHEISEDVVSFHARHLAASKSPFAFFQSPIFNSRSITGMAGDLRKVTNPKEILNGISYQLLSIYETVFEKPRVDVMFECKGTKREFYWKYLGMMVKQLTKVEESQINGISIENFPQERWLKYFPNFQQQLVFQCFSFPYYQKKSAAGLLLSSIVNKNILQYSQVGGSFLYKGTMVSFVAGGRRKVLQLEDYYRKLEGLDEAKRDLFKRFGRYSVKQWFESGVGIEEARFFKQAIIATEKQEVEEVLNECVLEVLKKGESSILSLGPRLQNYEPLLKKGWEIERPVDDLSLNVESYSTNEPNLRLQRYTKVC